MINIISIKTNFGWISAYEKKGNIYKVKFEKHKNKSISNNLKKFEINLKNFLTGKSKLIKSNCLI